MQQVLSTFTLELKWWTYNMTQKTIL